MDFSKFWNALPNFGRRSLREEYPGDGVVREVLGDNVFSSYRDNAFYSVGISSTSRRNVDTILDQAMQRYGICSFGLDPLIVILGDFSDERCRLFWEQVQDLLLSYRHSSIVDDLILRELDTLVEGSSPQLVERVAILSRTMIYTDERLAQVIVGSFNPDQHLVLNQMLASLEVPSSKLISVDKPHASQSDVPIFDPPGFAAHLLTEKDGQASQSYDSFDHHGFSALSLGEDDDFVILGSKSFWRIISPNQAKDIVRSNAKNCASKQLVKAAILDQRMKNPIMKQSQLGLDITVVVLFLDQRRIRQEMKDEKDQDKIAAKRAAAQDKIAAELAAEQDKLAAKRASEERRSKEFVQQLLDKAPRLHDRINIPASQPIQEIDQKEGGIKDSDMSTFMIQSIQGQKFGKEATIEDSESVLFVERDESFFRVLHEEILKVGLISTTEQLDDDSLDLNKKSEVILLCRFNVEDHVFEFYFKDYVGMGRIVGVGLDYAKVILDGDVVKEEGWPVKIIEILKEDWECVWKTLSNETSKVTSLESLAHHNNVMMKESQVPLDGRPLLWDIASYFKMKAFIVVSSLNKELFQACCNNASSSGNCMEASSSTGDGNDNVDDFANKSGKYNSGEDVNKGKGNEDNGNDNHDEGKDNVGFDIGLDATAIVHLVLRPGGSITKNNSYFDDGLIVEDKSYENDGEILYAKHELDNTISSNMTFIFTKTSNNRTKRPATTIKTIIGPITFGFKESNQDNYEKFDRFGWFHTRFDVSFGVVNSEAVHLCAKSKPLEVDYRSEIHTKASAVALSEGRSSALKGGGQLSAKFLKVNLGKEKGTTTGVVDTSNAQKSIDVSIPYTKGGFSVHQNVDMVLQKLTYKYISQIDYNYSPDILSNRHNLSMAYSWPISTNQMVKFQGQWRPDYHNVQEELVPYKFTASRVVEMTSKSHRNNIDKNDTINLMYTQQREREVYVNHALSHLATGIEKYELQERVKTLACEQHPMYFSEAQYSDEPTWINGECLVHGQPM